MCGRLVLYCLLRSHSLIQFGANSMAAIAFLMTPPEPRFKWKSANRCGMNSERASSSRGRRGSILCRDPTACPHIGREGTSDWNLYALAAAIEIERHRKTNPPLPDWLLSSYKVAGDRLVKLALSDLGGKPDELTLRCALSVIALGRGDLKLGALLNHSESAEIAAYVEENLAWSSLYTDDPGDLRRVEAPGSGH